MKTPVTSSSVLVPLAIAALIVFCLYRKVPSAKKEPYCSSCMMK